MTIRPAYGVSSSGVVDGSITLADLADPAGMPVVRRGAGFGGGHVNVSWSMSTQSVEFRFKACRRGGTGGHIVGAFVGYAPNVYVSASSSALSIRNGGIHIAVIDNALPEGVSRSFEVFIGQTGGTVRIDGQLVASPSWATITWNTHAAAYAIGAYHTGGAKFGGDIWDVSFIDPASAANSAYFPLDGRDSSGNYPNTLAGSTVADATVTGFVEDVLVNGTAAAGGGPVYVGSAFLHEFAASTAQTVSTAGLVGVALGTANLDQTSAKTGDTFVARAPGVVKVEADANLDITALGGTGVLSVTIAKNGTSQGNLVGMEFTAVNERQAVALTRSFTVATGDVISFELRSVASGDVYQLRGATMNVLHNITS